MKRQVYKVLLVIILLVAIYIIFINVFLYPCITQGMSMYPTISPNQIKLTNRWKVIVDKKNIKRGEIVTIEEPDILCVTKENYNSQNVIATYYNKTKINPFRARWMKRVIGIEGDHIQITENGILYINGQLYNETYIKKEESHDDYRQFVYTDVIVPQNTIYVMGDNRADSIDSRSFGCVPLEQVYSILI